MSNALLISAPPQQSFVSRLCGPIEPRTLLRALHLLLMLPLGTAYFVFFVTAFSLGGALIWTFPGPVVLLLAMLVARWLGDFEAALVSRIAGTPIRRPPSRLEGVSSFRDRVRTRLVDPTTWTGLAYLLIQFPAGIAAFTVVTTVVTVAGVLAAGPAIAWRTGDVTFFDGTSWEVVLDTPLEAIPLVPVGILLLFAAAHGVVTLSNLHAAWARLMLGSRARVLSSPPAPPTGHTDPGPSNEPVAFVAPPAAEPYVPAISGESPPGWNAAGLRDLTPREREVLLLLASGYSNAEIAESFVVSEGTVKTHVKRILAKLNVRDRAQAAVLAHQRGLLANPASPPATARRGC